MRLNNNNNNNKNKQQSICIGWAAKSCYWLSDMNFMIEVPFPFKSWIFRLSSYFNSKYMHEWSISYRQFLIFPFAFLSSQFCFYILLACHFLSLSSRLLIANQLRHCFVDRMIHKRWYTEFGCKRKPIDDGHNRWSMWLIFCEQIIGFLVPYHSKLIIIEIKLNLRAAAW